MTSSSDPLADGLRLALNRTEKPGDRRFIASLLAQHESGRQLSRDQMYWAQRKIREAGAPPVETTFGSKIDRDIFAEPTTPPTPSTLDSLNSAKLQGIVERCLGSIKSDLTEENDKRESSLVARQEAFNRNAARQIAEAATTAALARLEARLPRQVVVTVKRVDGSQHTTSGPTHPMFEKLLKHCSVRKDDGFVPGIFIAGERGSGKTTGCKLAAEALGMKFYTNGAISSDFQMLGYVDSGGNYHRTPFRDAFEFGGFYCFDEVDRSDDRALLAVNPHLANGCAAFPDGMVKRHPDCIITATGNTWGLGGSLEFSGACKLDEAFLSRFEVKLPWDVDLAFERKLVGNEQWYAFITDCRKRIREAGIKYTIDSRAAIVGAKLISQLGYTQQEAANETFLPSIKPDQRRIVMGLAS